MVSYKIKLDTREVERELRLMRVRSMAPKPIMAAAVALAEQDTIRRFDRQGPGWTQLAPSTIARRRKGGKKGKGRRAISILQDTATLKRSCLFGQPGNISKVTKRTATFGTDVEYAADHQFGRPERNLPARSFLGWKATTLRKLLTWGRRWVLTGEKPPVGKAA